MYKNQNRMSSTIKFIIKFSSEFTLIRTFYLELNNTVNNIIHIYIVYIC